MKILFFGSDRFSSIVLKQLLEHIKKFSKTEKAEIDICLSNLINTRKVNLKIFEM